MLSGKAPGTGTHGKRGPNRISLSAIGAIFLVLALATQLVILPLLVKFWPELHFLESCALLISLSPVILLSFLIALRAVVFLLIWILGYDCWVLPNLFEKTAPFVESFKPVISFKKTKSGQLLYRIGVAVAFFSCCYWVVTQPSEFDGFKQPQMDIVPVALSKDLYSGIFSSYRSSPSYQKYSLSSHESMLMSAEAEEYYEDEITDGVLPLHEDGSDEFDSFPENAFKRVEEEPVSTFSADVDTASYSYVRRDLNDGTLPDSQAVRPEEMINYFDYDYPPPDSMYRPFNATIRVSGSPWMKERKLIHVGIKGYNIQPTERRFSNLVFLIDVSGSMYGEDRLPLVKKSIEMLLPKLDPEDSVSIVTYADTARVELGPTLAGKRSKILKTLSQLNANGGTGGAGGLKLAYQMAEKNYDKDAINRIILATDGDFNIGPTDNDTLQKFVESKREKGIYLSVLGYGMGNYKDSRMKALANHGNGIAAYIDTLQEAKKVLVNEASSTLFPIANDVKLQIEFNPATVSEYRLIGYEKRLLNREDFNNDKVDAGEVGSGHTVTAIYEITPKGSKATVLDELRYSQKEDSDNKGGGAVVKEDANGNEYAFLKIRYKLPGENESELLQMPIMARDFIGVLEAHRPHDKAKTASPQSERNIVMAGTCDGMLSKVCTEFDFATAVAGFAQLLKGGKYVSVGTFGYEDVVSLAEASKGVDAHDYRNEFIELVRTAKKIAHEDCWKEVGGDGEVEKCEW